MYLFNCFTEQEIIAHVNLKLQNDGRRLRIRKFIKFVDLQLHNVLLFSSNTESQIVVHLYDFGKAYQFGIRAIHKVKNARKPFSWLFNGQASKNLNNILFFGENEPPVKAEGESYAKFLDSMYMAVSGMQKQQLVQGRLLSAGYNADIYQVNTMSLAS